MALHSFDSRGVARAAALGLTLGVSACKNGGATAEAIASAKVTSAAAPALSPSAMAKADPSKECCRGLNDCKGKGGCAIEGKNECAGKNECKGKGGCNMHCPQ
jgi:hypothetical protein